MVDSRMDPEEELNMVRSVPSTTDTSNSVTVSPNVDEDLSPSTRHERLGSDATLTKEKVSIVTATESIDVLTWDGADDPDDPKNWSTTRKWLATIVIAAFAFISPTASSMIAPALDQVAHDLGVQEGFQTSLLLSIFLIAFAVGPLFLGPMSEVFGRTKVLQSAFSFFLVFCLACGFAKTRAQFLIFRVIAGLGGSAPLAIGPGILSDLWRPEQRGKAYGYYLVGPLLSPALAPIFGGFIAEHTTWRWVFWSTAIYTGLAQIMGFFVLRETYAPVLLERRAAKRHQDVESAHQHSQVRVTPALGPLLKKAMKRPMYLLFTQPIVQALALFQLYNYGIVYILLTTFPTVWTDIYGQSAAIGGLNYLSIGLGFLVASIIAAPLNDRIYIYLKHSRGNGQGQPEYRVPMMFPASFLMVAGLFMYGWTVQYKTHWILPNIGIFLFSTGCIVSYQCAQIYNIDCYAKHAASSLAAVIMLRSIAGFGFPLFAPAMYERLGWGWGNSLLGFIAIGIGLTAPLAFWFFGEKLRQRSSHAALE